MNWAGERLLPGIIWLPFYSPKRAFGRAWRTAFVLVEVPDSAGILLPDPTSGAWFCEVNSSCGYSRAKNWAIFLLLAVGKPLHVFDSLQSMKLVSCTKFPSTWDPQNNFSFIFLTAFSAERIFKLYMDRITFHSVLKTSMHGTANTDFRLLGCMYLLTHVGFIFLFSVLECVFTYFLMYVCTCAHGHCLQSSEIDIRDLSL